MIKIKGINKNLVFVFEEGSFEEFNTFLENKMSQNPALFKGSPVVFRGPGLSRLSFDEMAVLQKLCLEYGMILNNIESNSAKNGPHNLIVRRNVRSGQKVHAEGSVVVWGDVHESAEVSAGEHIIVLGKLAGRAYAGYYGNHRSMVFALNLCPGQIRIGNYLSRSPERPPQQAVPEIAYLEDDNILIKEYYLPGKTKRTR